MSPWRSVFAWIGLVPLLWAVLCKDTVEAKHPLRRGFELSYLCGFLWYCGNCSWVRDTMAHYGDMPPLAPTFLLIGFSLVLGLYFGLVGVCLALIRRASGSARLALAAAPVLWAAMELAASRITSVPWDQLGYSQVDNGVVSQIATWTGVYGISFLLVAVNALIAAGFLMESRRARFASGAVGIGILFAGWGCVFLGPHSAPTAATAVLIQPNLDVGSMDAWDGLAWNAHMAEFKRLAEEQCKTYIAGIPQTGAGNGEIVCPPYPTHPDLVAWPESPAPYFEEDPRLQQSLVALAKSEQAPFVIGSIGADVSPDGQLQHEYNSALIVGPDGARIGRYDKIHLVPFGEYIPFQNLLVFARKLTGRVSHFDRGEERKVFRLNGHHYGVFICYEAVFAEEVRGFARLGAEVLVNISDDGWYGDTSAPWQHLNMARMRAIENRRWLLRDTNNGITAAIDPYGRVRQSIPRHVVDALPAEYGFGDDLTFYTANGDIFAWLCAILAIGLVGWALRASLRLRLQIQARS